MRHKPETVETNWDLLLPDPEPVAPVVTVISVDDHVVEPPHLFQGRMPAHLDERAPRVVETPEGHQVWEFEGERFTQVGLNAVAGRKPDSTGSEPLRFDQMRPGCFEVEARIRDMDLNGVWASMSFPSQIGGFCGRVFFSARDAELGRACVRAWNDWLYEEWYLAHPDRVVPLGITCLSDPQWAAAEIRRLGELGFRSVSFPERPHRIGLPSLWEVEHWDPIIRACIDTDMVLSVHVGSTGVHDLPPGYNPETMSRGLTASLFGQLSLVACAEWLWSGWAVRYPDLKIAMSEGGIGWVAMLLDRLDNVVDRSGYGKAWPVRPADVLARNFWFCTIDDPSTIDTRGRIGIDHIMVEVDYPHGDTTWPHTQQVIAEAWGHIPAPELRMMCAENAAALYRHPLPSVVLPQHDLPSGPGLTNWSNDPKEGSHELHTNT
jgi:predicted TIM-barrel fold metal-dependent hydrolase